MFYNDNLPNHFSPPWILVVLTIRYWDVLNYVKEEHALLKMEMKEIMELFLENSFRSRY